MKLNKAFGIVLKQLRVAKGLSQEALALEADLDRTFVSQLERGLKQPSLTTVFALAKVLGCRAAEMVAKVELSLVRRK